MKDFFENPAQLVGYPMLVLGLVGVGIAFLAAFAPNLQFSSEGEELGHGVAAPHGSHPGVSEYVMVGLVLAALTALEVAVYYVSALGEAGLALILAVLMISKFVLVVLFFMHLKFDNRLFSTAFTGGLLLAIAVFIVLLTTLGANIT
jgi:cytochrome c oxidase subunit IV